jgi:hypothetical protein
MPEIYRYYNGVTDVGFGEHKKTRPSRKGRVFVPINRGCELAEAYFFTPLSASPKMSPSDAPESDEPYCSTACFSSAS